MGLRWPAVLPYLLGRRRRHDADVAAAADMHWSRSSNRLPAGLELQWLGVAGFRLSYQGTTIVTDPYFSRAPLGAVARRKLLAADPRLSERLFERVDAVLVGHTHFDHAVDVPVLVQRFGAKAYGSASLARLLALHGQGENAVVAEPNTPYEIGPFRVTFVPSLHSRLVLGLKVPYDGEITCEHLDGLTGPAYRCGQVWGIHIEVAGRTFYHQGSCNLIDDAIQCGPVDYFLAGIAGRGFTRDYWPRILRRLEPAVIVPNHHDDFFTPLDAPMRFSFNVNVASFLEEIAAVSQDFEVCALNLLETAPHGPG